MREAAYLVADPDGVCLGATDAALALLGIDRGALRALRVDDFTSLDALDSVGEGTGGAALPAGWTCGATEIVGSGGVRISVRFAMTRWSAGEIIIRIERAEPAEAAPREKTVHDVLDAWRRQEATVAGLTPGSREFRLAETEAQWLSAEYQRLVSALLDEGPRGR